MAKWLRNPFTRSTATEAVKKLERVFVDLSGPIPVLHTLIVRVYLVRQKSDAVCAFKPFLAEVRADGTPSEGMPSGNGGEFFGGPMPKPWYQARVYTT